MSPGTNITSAQLFGHSHGEAYMKMTYVGASNAGRICLTIWNSRDGVTPFMMFCHEYGIQLQHVNWGDDKYEPDYIPKKGDLIWRDITDEEIRDIAATQFDGLIENLKEMAGMTDDEIKKKYSYDAKAHLQRMIAEGKEKWIESAMKSKQPGEPHLELVKEDWPGAQAQRNRESRRNEKPPLADKAPELNYEPMELKDKRQQDKYRQRHHGKR